MIRAHQTAAEVARALGGSRNGSGWLCRCPVAGHGRGRGDQNPSLSVADGNRQLLVYCFAGCDPKDVLAALSSRGLSCHGDTSTTAVRELPAAHADAAVRAAAALWDAAVPPD